jgi:hypothetical protein
MIVLLFMLRELLFMLRTDIAAGQLRRRRRIIELVYL